MHSPTAARLPLGVAVLGLLAAAVVVLSSPEDPKDAREDDRPASRGVEGAAVLAVETTIGPPETPDLRRPAAGEVTSPRPSGRVRLVDEARKPVAGAETWLQAPGGWTAMDPSDAGGELPIAFPDDEPRWIRIRARGFAEERRFLFPFSGTRELALTAGARIEGRVVPDDAALDATRTRVVCWEQPRGNAALSTKRLLGTATGSRELFEAEAVGRDGRFVIEGLIPGRKYMLYALHPHAASRGVSSDVVPGPAEVLVPLESIWAATLEFTDEDGRPRATPTAPYLRTHGRLLDVQAPPGCVRVATYVERDLERGLPAHRDLLAFRWRGAGPPPPVRVTARFPSCPEEELEVPVHPLADPRAADPVAVRIAGCAPVATLDVRIAVPPPGPGLRDARAGYLELVSIETGDTLTYALDAAGRPFSWSLEVPRGRYDARLTDALGFFRAETGGRLGPELDVGPSGARLEPDLADATGCLSIELLASEDRAFQEEFLCDLELLVAGRWQPGRSNLRFPGAAFRHRAVVPLLPAGRYALVVDPRFVAVAPEPAAPSSPDEPLRVELQVEAGKTTEVVLTAMR